MCLLCRVFRVVCVRSFRVLLSSVFFFVQERPCLLVLLLHFRSGASTTGRCNGPSIFSPLCRSKESRILSHFVCFVRILPPNPVSNPNPDAVDDMHGQVREQISNEWIQDLSLVAAENTEVERHREESMCLDSESKQKDRKLVFDHGEKMGRRHTCYNVFLALTCIGIERRSCDEILEYPLDLVSFCRSGLTFEKLKRRCCGGSSKRIHRVPSHRWSRHLLPGYTRSIILRLVGGRS